MNHFSKSYIFNLMQLLKRHIPAHLHHGGFDRQ